MKDKNSERKDSMHPQGLGALGTVFRSFFFSSLSYTAYFNLSTKISITFGLSIIIRQTHVVYSSLDSLSACAYMHVTTSLTTDSSPVSFVYHGIRRNKGITCSLLANRQGACSQTTRKHNKAAPFCSLFLSSYPCTERPLKTTVADRSL